MNPVIFVGNGVVHPSVRPSARMTDCLLLSFELISFQPSVLMSWMKCQSVSFIRGVASSSSSTTTMTRPGPARPVTGSVNMFHDAAAFLSPVTRHIKVQSRPPENKQHAALQIFYCKWRPE